MLEHLSEFGVPFVQIETFAYVWTLIMQVGARACTPNAAKKSVALVGAWNCSKISEVSFLQARRGLI